MPLKAIQLANCLRLGLIGEKIRPWVLGKSRRYLWKPHHVRRAIDYVHGQGDIPEFDD